MSCPPRGALWIMSKSSANNARFHLCRTGDLHKFCCVTAEKRFCFYCTFYFCRGVCAQALMPPTCQRWFALPLPEQPPLPAQPAYLWEENGQLSPPICGWVGDASASIPVLCWDSTAARLLFAELYLSSRWNISSCQSQPRHFESMCLSPELLHITVRCIATAL